MMTMALLLHTQLMRSQMLYLKYLLRDLHLVQYRTDLSTRSTTLTMYQRIHHLLNLVSVIQIWQKRWSTTARTTFLHRLDSLCSHRQISQIRVYFLSYSKMYKENFSGNRRKPVLFLVPLGK